MNELKLVGVRVHIRWMIRRDMEEVLTIEASTDDAWTEEDFLRCLRQRNCIGMVAEQGNRVIGYMVYELHKWKLELLRMVIHPRCRRRGIGQQMMAKLASKLSDYRRTRINAVVRETDMDTILFCKAADWKAVKVLRNWYEDSGEDAYLMQYGRVSENEE